MGELHLLLGSICVAAASHSFATGYELSLGPWLLGIGILNLGLALGVMINNERGHNDGS